MNSRPIIVISIALSIAAAFFFFSFSGFSTIIATNDVVNNDQIFISTDQTAVDGFIETLEEELETLDIPEQDQALGVILTVVMKDSNGDIIPQEQNFLTIPEMVTQSLITVGVDDQKLLDFAVLQFDFEAVLVKDDRIGEITIDYEMTMNRGATPFLTGTAFGSGQTTDHRLNLDFEQGSKIGNAIELDFEKGEVPIRLVTGNSYRNTLDVTVTKVSALVGTEFGTQQFQWIGEFPVYKLKFDADSETLTVRNYQGIAIQTLPNDITIQECGKSRLHHNNWHNGADYSWGPSPQKIKVYQDGKLIATSRSPDVSSAGGSSCGGLVGGIPRGADLQFTVNDGAYIDVHTPDTQKAYVCNAGGLSSSATYCSASCTGTWGAPSCNFQ